MASNYTSNYKLCQWEPSDKVLRTEFNADNAKIDAAIKAVDDRLTTLDSAKADLSALNTLQSIVTAHGAALNLRNCRFVTGSYVGNGKYGPGTDITLTFPGKPVFLCVSSTDNTAMFFAIRGQNVAWEIFRGAAAKQILTWNENSVSWYVYQGTTTVSSTHQLNHQDYAYQYFALLEAD